jgi:hypothetical protein
MALKKIATILLLSCLCLNITGYHIIFQFRKATLKAAMKKMLHSQVHNDDLIVFHFAVNAPQAEDSPEWEEENEFMLQGKMYDVVDKRIENGQLVVRCISDDNETDLINKYQEILEKQFGGHAKNRSASLLKLIMTPFTIPVGFFSHTIEFLLHTDFPIFHCTIPASCREVITPPPRFL